ncbi:MAG: DUF2550 domain-containing protein [Actinomycetota bacterium]|nr:DUF2550 domain-containing protein [Geodermatophilaceae bacterium]MDQ3506075.1 DUF2550 domain-containing protein [Actinomycetota bacterium]
MTTTGKVIAASLLLLLVLLLVGSFVVRRSLLLRGIGAVEIWIKLSPRRWSLGVGWFGGDELSWYRVFSLSPRPARVLVRGQLEVVERRRPGERDAIVLPRNAIILACRTPHRTEQVAMSTGAVNGLLSWLEAQPPGYPIHDVRAG